MVRSYTEKDSFILLEEISDIFISFLGELLEITKTNKINFLGIGNSISSGWTAVDNNVQPWIEKMKPFIDEKCQKSGIQCGFATFALVGKNSNERIYNFLKTDPSLKDVKDYFSLIFDNWKARFDGTIFENSVEKDIAMQYYYNSNRLFSEYYDNQTFSISTLFGCTGEFLSNIPSSLKRGGLKNIIDKEILYMQPIVELLLEQSKNSYVTIGNFPYISRNALFFLNYIIKDINERIKEISELNKRTMYYEGIYLDLVNIVNGKIKIDNHPNLAWQYTSLYNYIIYLMENIPVLLYKEDKAKDIKKLKGLDFDGNLEKRLEYINKK